MRRVSTNEEEMKFDTNEDILFQIAMTIYDKHNSNIASINDNLGNIFSYKDLEDAEKAELEDEKRLLELAVKQLQQERKILIKYLEDRIKECNDSINIFKKKDCSSLFVGVEISHLEDFTRIYKDILEKLRSDKYERNRN